MGPRSRAAATRCAQPGLETQAVDPAHGVLPDRARWRVGDACRQQAGEMRPHRPADGGGTGPVVLPTRRAVMFRPGPVGRRASVRIWAEASRATTITGVRHAESTAAFGPLPAVRPTSRSSRPGEAVVRSWISTASDAPPAHAGQSAGSTLAPRARRAAPRSPSAFRADPAGRGPRPGAGTTVVGSRGRISSAYRLTGSRPLPSHQQGETATGVNAVSRGATTSIVLRGTRALVTTTCWSRR